ncbi:hypothetical protein I4U23_016767 [Adineta vaga]|nr:hypothetical protein I4U23_016767 [Adineta vaga]
MILIKIFYILSLIFYVYGAPASDQFSDTDIKTISPCPHILCAAIQCDNPIPTFLTFNGQKCQGCPRCPIPCPLIKCAAPLCDNPQPTSTIINGQKCPGCPRCPPIECPELNCLAVVCENPQQTSIKINGKQCPGCPRCDLPTAEQI